MKRAALCFLLVFVAAAQEPIIRSTVVNVQVPVTVTNKQSRPVTNLTLNDFKLLDNGIAQDFQLDIVNHPVSLVVAVQTNTPAKKILPLVQNTSSLLEPLLAGETGEVAVLTFDHTVQTLLPFTNKADSIHTTFLKLTVGGTQHHLDDAALEGIRLLNTRAKGRKKILVLIGEAQDLGSAVSTRDVFQRAELDGILVYAVTMKLPAPLPPRVTSRNPIPPEGRAPLPMGTIQTQTTDVQNGAYAPTVAEMYEIVRGITASNSLEAYAAMTGGTQQTFDNQKQLEAALQQIGREVHNQYLLTFAPSQPTAGFHSLAVEVKVPGTKVRARRAYRVAPEVR